MAKGIKAFAPLIAGALLLIAGIGGAVLTSMQPAAPKKKPPPTAAELLQQAAEERKEKAEEKKRLAVEQAKIDKNEIKQIILTQIRATPKELSEEWFNEAFQYIPSEEAFWEFLDEALARGRTYDEMFSADYRERNPRKAQPPGAGYYVEKAREIIYAASPPERHLVNMAPGLLDMALNREFLAHEDGWDGARPHIMKSYFKTRLRLYDELREIAIKGGGERTAWWEEIATLHEATVFYRHILMRENREQAVKKLKDTGSSGRVASFDAKQQRSTMNEHLIKLGKFYIDAAMAETTYLGKQREYNERGFMLLAMVYQRKPSGEALDILTKANVIQRNQLWRMGKAHWRRATHAASSGDSVLAHEQYLQAKRRYLQSLSRVETSKKRKLLDELVALQKEINAWKQAASDTVKSATADPAPAAVKSSG